MKSSRLIVAASVAMGAVFGIGAASAADLPARTYAPPPIAPPIYDWSGVYVGANAGYGSSRICQNPVLATLLAGGVPVANVPLGALPQTCGNAAGAFAGGQVGYRYQVSSWVFGLEGQGDWASLRGTAPSPFLPGASALGKVEALGLFTGSAGYAWNNVLLYAKGGGALSRNQFTPGAFGLLPVSETRLGAAVGTGVEIGFAPNWSIGLEYDHLFMGSRNLIFNTPTVAGASFAVTTRIRQDVDMGMLRITYHWGAPAPALAPVVSKY